MDLQYVLNPYACAKYILSYITKGQKGISKLLEAACQEARDGNLDIKQQKRAIGNKFVNAVEISAPQGGHSIIKNTRRLARLFGVWDFGWEKIFWGSSKILI